MSKNLCVIPARGGSKRIPRKNIRNFLGKPIIAYSIEAAIKSQLFDEVMVSTEDEEIAQVAREYGAKVPFLRSQKNANDFAATVDVLLEVIREYELLGENFKNVCCLYPTAPFVNSNLIKIAFERLKSLDVDCVFPIIRYSFPIQRALVINKSNRVEMLNPENMQVRSQDLKPSFHDAGQFYFLDAKTLMKEKVLWTRDSSYVEVEELQAQDIDTLTDWRLAEIKYKLLSEEK